ncbi:MAG: cell envelope integrity protein CreD [Ferruginibacter sp.]
MERKYTGTGIACRIWLLTSFVITVAISIYFSFEHFFSAIPEGALFFIGSLVCSLPAFVVMLLFIPAIDDGEHSWRIKFFRLLVLQFVITIFYGLVAAFIDISTGIFTNHKTDLLFSGFIVSLCLFTASFISSLIILPIIAAYFSGYKATGFSHIQLLNFLFQHTSKKNTTMETYDHEQQPPLQMEEQTQSNKLLIKGIITGVLILLMLIPTIFIDNIIKEREQRQIEAVKEVSTKWASSQTISGPYLVVPYTDTTVNSDGKTITIKKQLVVLANELDVNGNIFPEERQRSIYKVLLYKSNIKLAGNFKPKWPLDINTANIDFANARLCFGITDFKGIEEELQINFNNKLLPLSPGLPLTDLDDIGLSVPVSTSLDAINAGIPFTMEIKLKGSEKLYFMPLSANSKFSLGSAWPNPSFVGNSLPNERQVNEKGFFAKWNFNQANLPFGTVLKQGTVNKVGLAFGVSMVQPADQYAKTMRSVKYAILFIGLTFALFFIIEIMQRKPFHPVQYVLVGLALVIFYTLLLSISEYLLFDQAYLIAATATVVLISLYAKSHFDTWKAAGIFFTTLGLLYGFIFILIRLEDTALLVGSIGLFIVLALIMYASRKVKWYGKEL